MAKRGTRKRTAPKRATKKRTTTTRGSGTRGGARKRKTAKRATGRRELIDTGRNKMFGRRNARGEFTEMDDVGRSLAADRRRRAKRKAPRGQGDRGDR
jgi:hypothetical protein